MLKDKTLTYISLFSCAGVGCFGFKKAGFECIATNELIERRLNVQKYNNKCRFESGYICDDITTDETKNKIFKEIDRWKELGNDRVDVLIATPPCQGMSVANHKKAENEIVRNSLVVESVHLIQKVAPRFFIFENVAAFMKTGCTAPDGTVKAIGDVVYEELSDKYIIVSRILNFKNYGSNSSRKKTVYYTTKYERSAQNREEAIRIHGTKCMICGFDFEKKYGELGKGYIEVHHIKPLSDLDEEVVVNPATDLICVCSNCHRMLHRFRSYMVSVEELRRIVKDNE